MRTFPLLRTAMAAISSALILWTATDQATTAGAISAPTPLSPPNGETSATLGPVLQWTNPAGATQYQIQVLPFNGDGPGINLIRNAATSYTVPAPRVSGLNYIMLPGMTYTWRVRVTDKTTSVSENDSSWSPWSASFSFRTPAPTSASLSVAYPANGGATADLVPVLRWADSNSSVFYYEVQVSGDTRFDADPVTATSFVYWNLVHGGATQPLNSWQTPALQSSTTYYWRVRPRIQGDGTAVAWSPAWSFRTPSDLRLGVNGGWDRLDGVQQMGFNWLKLAISWKQYEPSRGAYQLDNLASTINRATSRGMKILLRVDDTPDWASSRPGSFNAPPANDADLGNFMFAVASRFKDQLEAYELYNETNLNYEWGGFDPDPIRYGEILKAVYPRIKAADPTSVVITGGVSTTGDGETGPYLSDLYYLEKLVDPNRDGNPADGYAPYFDAVGTHPYGGPYAFDTPRDQATMGTYFRRAEDQRNHLLSHGVDKPFWATEFGWIINPAEDGLTCTFDSHFTQLMVSSQFQAQQLAGAYQHAATNWPWMKAMFLFNFDMAMDSYRQQCDQVRFFSLMKGDGTFRPAFYALRDMPR